MASAFVLYAAEWWRREYAGGHWEWEPIFTSVGVPVPEVSPKERSEFIARGFRFWGHLIPTVGVRFFGAIATQGGLPGRLIEAGSGALATLLRVVLGQAARYLWERERVLGAIVERAHELPKSLQREPIYGLVADIVMSVIELRRECGNFQGDEAIALLDARVPDWRERFPLSLEDEPARALLDGLVQAAAVAAQVPSGGWLAVQRLLLADNSGSRFTLSAHWQLPRTVPVTAVASFFGLEDESTLPRYFTLDARIEGSKPLAQARQLVGSDSATVILDASPMRHEGQLACNEHCVALRADALPELAPKVASGGEALEAEEPWIFAERDGAFVYIGSGSLRLPDESACIALPQGWQARPDASGARVMPTGTLTLEDTNERTVVRVIAGAFIERPGTRYRLQLSQGAQDAPSFAWEGKRLLCRTMPSAVFRGLPALHRIAPDGARQRVSPAQLRWLRADTLTRLNDPTRFCGRVVAELLDDDNHHEVVRRFRLTVVPAAARIRFESNIIPSEGSIALSGWETDDIAAYLDGRPVPAIAMQDELVLALKAATTPPASVPVTLCWTKTGTEVELQLPFPSTGGYFVDGDGQRIAAGSVLLLSQLAGVRLMVFDRNRDRPQRYELEFALEKAARAGSPVQELIRSIRLNEAHAEVRLIDYRSDLEMLLGASDELDSAVCVTLMVGKRPAASLCLRRYAAALERQPEALALPTEVLTHYSVAQLQATTAIAAPLLDPDGVAVRLAPVLSEGVPTGRWNTRGLTEASAPWLIHPAADAAIAFRPTLWMPAMAPGASTPTLAPAAGNTCPLTVAMRLREPEARRAALRQVLEAMAGDFHHASWQLVDYLYATFRALPLASLDLWLALADAPEAAAALLVRLDSGGSEVAQLARRLQSELALPFPAIPVSAWRRAIRSLQTYWQQDAGAKADTIVKHWLDDRFRHLSSQLPTLQLLFDFLLWEQNIQPSAALLDVLSTAQKRPGQASDALWKGADSLLQRLLLRVHDREVRWPDRHFFWQKALPAFSERCPNHCKTPLSRHLCSLFWSPNGAAGSVKAGPVPALSIANIPVLCALWCACDVQAAWWAEPAVRAELHQLRCFNPTWFDQAWSSGLAMSLTYGLLTPLTGPSS